MRLHSCAGCKTRAERHHASTFGKDVPARDRDRVRGARPRRCPRPAGPRHRQPRHRPAGLQDARARGGGGGEGPARRPSRLHPRAGHPRAARGGCRGHCTAALGGGRSGAHRGGPRRQGHDVLRHRHVRRARGGDPVPESRLSHLRIGDQLERRPGGGDSPPRRAGLLVRRGGGARPRHPANPPHHPQLARQPHRGSGTAGGDRAPGGGPPRTPRRRDHERRDLLAHDLRRTRARFPARLSRDRGPPHPPRRLEQDLRDDRLANGLRRLAGKPGGERHPPRGQLPLLRQRRGPVRGPRRAHRPPGQRARNGERLRPAPPGHRRRTQPPARRAVPHSRAGPSTPFPTSPAPEWTHAPSRAASSRRRGWRRSPAPASAPTAKGYLRFSYANSVENIERALERIAALLA